jgi:hypothetical protein
MFFDQVNQGGSGLKPGAAEGECRTWDFGHAKDSDVEAAAGFNISDNKGDMIKLVYLDWGLHGGRLRLNVLSVGARFARVFQ